MPSADEAALVARFAVSQYTTWNQTFEEDIALYQKLGVECLELCERKLSTDPGRRRRQIQRVRDAGMKVTSVQPAVHALFPDSMSPQVTSLKERGERFRATIAWVAEEIADQRPPLVTVSGPAPNGDLRRAHEYALESYASLADVAAEAGLAVMFEPLNPVFMNTDTFICTLAAAVALIDAVRRPNFGIVLDSWHIWREYGVLEQIERLGERILCVHLSDWPRPEPRLQADRAVPGSGVIDLAGLVAAIERAGYRGAYCLEIFSSEELEDSLWRADQAEVITASRAGVGRALSEANAALAAEKGR
jgi:sugar phosphate isomerase/epimerase